MMLGDNRTLLVALSGSLLGLDTYSVGQVMISRPLVAGTLVGLLLGQPVMGVSIGALLELLWIGKLPIGTNAPADITMPTVIAVFMAVVFKGQGLAQPEIMAVLLALPLGFFSCLVERLLRRVMTYYAPRVENRLRAGRESYLTLTIGAALAVRCVVVFSAYWFAAWAALAAAPGLQVLPSAYYEDAMKVMSWLLPAAGAAAVLHLFAERGGWLLGTGSFIGSLLLLHLGWHGYILLLILAACAVGMFINLRREADA